MKVVVCGDGKVGSTVAEQLAKEGHDLVIIDSNPNVVNRSSNSLDVLCIHGNAASRRIQIEAGVQDADLLIAVTSTDELNLLCCLIAKKLGAKHTIARVRNPEYASDIPYIQKDLGLSMSVNPELEAAREIARSLRFPSAIKTDSFAKGRVDLVEFKVKEGSPLIGKSLKDLFRVTGVKVLVCAVMRNNQAMIPRGNFVIEENDKLTITARPYEILLFFMNVGLPRQTIKNIMIVGGGRIAYYLVQNLYDMNYSIKVIEHEKATCDLMAMAFPKINVIHGDGTDHDLLLEEGIEDADAFIALTGMDEENILLSINALDHNTKKVVTKVNRTNFNYILNRMGIDTVISPKHLTANQITRYVRAMQNSMGSNVEALTRIVSNQVEALEFHVNDTFKYHDIPLKDLRLKSNVLIACVMRDGHILFADGNTEIKSQDNVIVVTTRTGLDDLMDIFE